MFVRDIVSMLTFEEVKKSILWPKCCKVIDFHGLQGNHLTFGDDGVQKETF